MATEVEFYDRARWGQQVAANALVDLPHQKDGIQLVGLGIAERPSDSPRAEAVDHLLEIETRLGQLVLADVSLRARAAYEPPASSSARRRPASSDREMLFDAITAVAGDRRPLRVADHAVGAGSAYAAAVEAGYHVLLTEFPSQQPTLQLTDKRLLAGEPDSVKKSSR